VAVCRRYPFIREFATEVLREHFLMLRRQTGFRDFDPFYSAKALWHAELDDIGQVNPAEAAPEPVRMLREADLLSDQYEIQPANSARYLAQLLARQGRRGFPRLSRH
jgi:hypothetical protein